MKKHNFNAGPAILPDSVLEKAAASVIDLNGSGLSILEVSHRGADFTAIIERAEALTRQILDLPDDYAVLFLSGGASSQFFMTAMNLLDESGKAYYVGRRKPSKKPGSSGRSRCWHLRKTATTPTSQKVMRCLRTEPTST